MKNFSTIFDFFLVETVVAVLVSVILYFLDDSFSPLLFKVSIISLGITLFLGTFGYVFKLFKAKDPSEDY